MVLRWASSTERFSQRQGIRSGDVLALLGNNDLWNLVPVDPVGNGSKSDKLASVELLRSRQSSIVQSWQVVRDEVPEAFGLQAFHLPGRSIDGPQKWEDLFTRLREAVELIALQRA